LPSFRSRSLTFIAGTTIILGDHRLNKSRGSLIDVEISSTRPVSVDRRRFPVR